VTDPRTDPSPSSGAQPRAHVTPAHRIAGALTLIEGLVLVGFVVFYVVEMVSGATDDLSRAAVSAVLILIFAIALLALARAWFRADEWPKTPTVLWNVLLLPVAWSLREGDRTALALAVGVVAAASIVAAAASPRAPRDTPGGS
jgi:MFS family permease